MTFGSLWGAGNPTAPAISSIKERFAPPKYYAVERGDTDGYSYGGGGGGQSYSYGPPRGGSYGGAKKSKKSDKKQVAMSAMTLIAFLFFINILQQCLKEHTDHDHHTAAIMMVNPSHVHARDPNIGEQEMLEKIDEEEADNMIPVKTSRKLLSVDEEETEEVQRRSKFIHDLSLGPRDWTKKLSEVSDEDLMGQKKKVDRLKQLWRKQKLGLDELSNSGPIKRNKLTLEENGLSVKVKKFVNNPILSDLKGIPKLSQYWAAQKTTTQPPETKYVEFEEPAKKVADFHEFEPLSNKNPDFPPLENSIVESLHLQAVPTHDDEDFARTNIAAAEETIQHIEAIEVKDAKLSLKPIKKPWNPVGVIQAIAEPYGSVDSFNTPRYRRSDEQLTTQPSEGLFYPEIIQVTPNPASEPTTTAKTYHVYTHPSQIFSNMWKTTKPYKTTLPSTTTTTSTTPASITPKFDIGKIYLTTIRPMPGRVRPTHQSHHFSGKPLNHRPHYGPLTTMGYDERYKIYSPHRRVGYDPPVVRQEYYPMSVVGQYGGNEGSPGLGLLQLLWTLVSSFAKPLARLVPNVSKVGGEDQCFHLLACEAHRMASYMGPTAQTLATTLSSLLTWVIPETEKSAYEAATAAARENTCAQQIQACDERSGGKSAMTMVAKLMELRPQREGKLTKS